MHKRNTKSASNKGSSIKGKFHAFTVGGYDYASTSVSHYGPLGSISGNASTVTNQFLVPCDFKSFFGTNTRPSFESQLYSEYRVDSMELEFVPNQPMTVETTLGPQPNLPVSVTVSYNPDPAALIPDVNSPTGWMDITDFASSVFLNNSSNDVLTGQPANYRIPPPRLKLVTPKKWLYIDEITSANAADDRQCSFGTLLALGSVNNVAGFTGDTTAKVSFFVIAHYKLSFRGRIDSFVTFSNFKGTAAKPAITVSPPLRDKDEQKGSHSSKRPPDTAASKGWF